MIRETEVKTPNTKPGPGRAASVTKLKSSLVLCNSKGTSRTFEEKHFHHSVFKKSGTQEILPDLPIVLNAKNMNQSGPLKETDFNDTPVLKGENYSAQAKRKGNPLRAEKGPPSTIPCDILQDERQSSIEKNEDAAVGVRSFNSLPPCLAIESTYHIRSRKPILAPLQFQQSIENTKSQFIFHQTSITTGPRENDGNEELERPAPTQVRQPAAPIICNTPDECVHIQTEEFPPTQESIFEADNLVSSFQTNLNCRGAEKQNGGVHSHIPAFLDKKQSMPISYCAPNQGYCYLCRKYSQKASKLNVGATNWAVAGLLCSLGCYFGCCLVPFCIDFFKDEVQYCVECNGVL